MKHKILSLLLLGLVCSIGNAWADETIFSMSVKSTVDAEQKTDTETKDAEYSLSEFADFGVASTSAVFAKTSSQGGTAASYLKSQSSHYYFTISSSINKTYFKLTLNKALAVGDVISWKIYDGSSSKSLGLYFNTSASTSGQVGYGATLSASKNQVPQSYTIKTGDAIVDQTVIYIGRYDGTTTYFDELTINRPATTPGTISFSPENGVVEQGSNISVTSTNATSIYYAWSSSETEPETPASWSYVTATAGVGSVSVPSDVTGTRYLYAYGKNSEGSGTIAHASYTIVAPRTATSLAFVSPTTTVGVDGSVTNVPTLTPAVVGAAFTYESSNESVATVNEDTGEVTGIAVGSATITAHYAGNASYGASDANYTINVVQSAVDNKFWNGGDWTEAHAGTYTGSIYIDNMEIKGTSSQGVQISTGGEKTIDGHSVAARIRLGKAGSSDGNYLHFKVKPNTTITYWGIRASSGQEANGLALSFGTFGNNEQTYSFEGGDVEYMTYNYTGAVETDVFAYSKASSGASMLAIKVEPYVVDMASPTISTEQDEEDATIGTPLNLTVTADHYTSLQWYKAEESDLSDGTSIDGATSLTYAYTAAKADALKTYYFYCIATNANATGEDEAQSSALTVTVGNYERSTACKALQVVYSNGFDAFITHPRAASYYTAEDDEVIAGTKEVGDIKLTAANGTITAYYLAGTTAPTISDETLSDDATYAVDGTTLTVTAEDGTTTGVYDITLTAVEPYMGGDITFDGTETWVKAPYGFVENKGYKYQRLKRDNESTDPWDRLTPGNTRIYLFLGANTSVTLKTTQSNGNVDVKVNTTTVKSNVSWGSGIEVTNELNAPYLLGIYSHQTSGDNYLTSIEITKPTSVNGTISASGWNTFSSNFPLDLSTITNGTAYVASGVAEGVVTLTPCTDKIESNTGLMIKGDASSEFTINTTSDEATFSGTNLLAGCPSATVLSANANHYVLVNNSGAEFQSLEEHGATIPAGKAYLDLTGITLAPGALRIVEVEDNATSIQDLQSSDDVIKFFENGQLFILKNGITYDLLGRIVK